MIMMLNVKSFYLISRTLNIIISLNSVLLLRLDPFKLRTYASPLTFQKHEIKIIEYVYKDFL